MSLIRTSSTTTEAIDLNITSAGQFSVSNPPEQGVIYTNNTVGTITTTFPSSQVWTAGLSLVFNGTGFVATGGSAAQTIQTITATGNIIAWNSTVLIDATAGNMTVTLPTCASNLGKSITLKRIDGTTNTITVASAGAELSELSNGGVELNKFQGAITLTVVLPTLCRQVANIGLVTTADLIQTVNATGTAPVNAWGSTILIPTLTGNITLNYPTSVSNIGKRIIEIMIGVPNAFTITRVLAGNTFTLTNNGSELLTQNGSLTVEAIDATNIRQVSNIGRTTTTTTRAIVRASNGSAVASAGSAAITFATEELDTTNSFNPTTGTFTAPRTGQYRVSGQFFAGSSSATIGTRFGVILSTNGNTFGAGSPIFSYFVSTVNPSNVTFGGSYIKTLNAGDTLTFRALLDTAAGMTLAANSNFDFITIEEINNFY